MTPLKFAIRSPIISKELGARHHLDLGSPLHTLLHACCLLAASQAMCLPVVMQYFLKRLSLRDLVCARPLHAPPSKETPRNPRLKPIAPPQLCLPRCSRSCSRRLRKALSKSSAGCLSCKTFVARLEIQSPFAGTASTDPEVQLRLLSLEKSQAAILTDQKRQIRGNVIALCLDIFHHQTRCRISGSPTVLSCQYGPLNCNLLGLIYLSSRLQPNWVLCTSHEGTVY